MITIYNGGSCILGMPDNSEMALTNSGTYVFGQLSYITTGTNANYDLTWCRSGAYVSVDSGGVIAVTDGESLPFAFSAGFAIAVATVGSIIGVLWVVRRFTRLAGIPNVTE